MISLGECLVASVSESALPKWPSPKHLWLPRANSTRGLDSATALRFVESLRLLSDLTRAAHAVAAHQASQSIYDIFDKDAVLYEGRQVFWGPASAAKAYFEQQGSDCPLRQTTSDFLASVTNPHERRAKPGMEDRIPRTPEDFEMAWLNPAKFKQLRGTVRSLHTKDNTQLAVVLELSWSFGSRSITKQTVLGLNPTYHQCTDADHTQYCSCLSAAVEQHGLHGSVFTIQPIPLLDSRPRGLLSSLPSSPTQLPR